MSRLAALGLLAFVGCGDGIDAPWQLDHDRIIAVRATSPRIAATEQTAVEALLGRVGERPATEAPSRVAVLSPASLADTVAHDGMRWLVTAPDEARLAAVRTELGLAADAPVPLVVEVGVDASRFPSGGAPAGFAATKTLYLGERATNPSLETVEIDGQPAGTSELVVARDQEISLAVPFDDAEDVNWLTSCGSMHDYDLARAYLRVEADDRAAGELAVVVRMRDGGVTWRHWPIRAD